MLVDEVDHDVFKGKHVNEICVAIGKFLRYGTYNYDKNRKK